MPEGTKRRLAAIVSADVVGYSRLMQADEAGTHARLRARFRELVAPSIERYGGRVFKLMGDGLLAEFPSVVAASDWAVEVQGVVAKANADDPPEHRIEYRVGVNLGDIIVDGDDLYGDGVNLAARLQEIAETGGVCLSDDAYRQARGKVSTPFADGGEESLKNIEVPVRVWRWTPGGGESAPKVTATAPDTLTLPDKPSIAVLRFDNMSGDPEQEFFADGIAEDLITTLSRFRSLFVIARNSSFTYKGQAVNVTQVARELGVRYVVEGSVRKAGDRVRITAQLIDAISGKHLWADHFDGRLDDVFDLQDQITEQIVVVVEPEIQARERIRARRKPPENLDAWELVQRGLSHLYRISEADRSEAVRLFREAIALDPEFAVAHAHLAFALPNSLMWSSIDDDANTEARTVAEHAVSLDPNDSMAHFALGRVKIFIGEIEMAIAEMRTAIGINPSFAWGHHGLGYAHHWGTGKAEPALAHYDAALRLSPRDPMRWRTLMLKGSALRMLGCHEEAIMYCRQACQYPVTGFLPYINLAAAAAEAGLDGEAQAAVDRALRLEPALSLDFIRKRYVGRHETALKSLLDGLQMAGMPD